MSRKKPPISEEERALFRQAVQDAHPLEHDRTPPRPPRIRPVPRQRHLDDARVVRDMFSDELDPAELETGEELFYARAGLQYGVLRKLRRGLYSVGAELDLHGLTSAEARQALSEFLHECRQRNIRCVRIIHGKGYGSRQQQPVLKRKLNHWLPQWDNVLAFCSARQFDGGTGAVYVLLKRG